MLNWLCYFTNDDDDDDDDVSVTGGYNCVDFRRFYVPYGTLHEHVRPTRDGISFHLDEWAELLVVIPTIHERHPELAEICAESQLQLHG